jgi:SAM-dependent methyltransferase
VSRAERDKWDARYRDGAYESRTHPTALLEAWAPRLPRGRALDVACGAGRNALYLAELGYQVDALDISGVALDRARRSAEQRALNIHWQIADFDEDPALVLPADRYDLIVWVRYVNPHLMPHLIARLRPGGHLVCEQHLVTAAGVAGPRNAAFRLEPGTLRASAAGMIVLHDYEGLVTDPDGQSVALAQLVARSAP